MTLEDVARRAAVSTATASRVLRNSTSVKSTTRARVQEAIETLRYNPNSHARSLATGTNRTIGVIVSNLENPFFQDICIAVSRRAETAGYEVIVSDVGGNPANVIARIRMMLGRRVAGVAAIVTGMDPELTQEIAEHQIPVVLYDSGVPRKNTLIIRTNYQHPLEIVFNYLCSLGHRRIGCIGNHTVLSQIDKCMQTRLDAIPERPHLHLRTLEVDDDPEEGRLAIRTLLALDSKLTGFVCTTDWLAMGALRGLRENGLRVPTDVSLTGFDNVSLAQYCDPPLTSVHIPRDKMGEIIYEFLTDREHRFPRELFIDPEVIVRDSTGPNPSGLLQ